MNTPKKKDSEKTLEELERELSKALKREDDMEIERLERIIERRKNQLPEPMTPLHTGHHARPNTTSINDDGCLNK